MLHDYFQHNYRRGGRMVKSGFLNGVWYINPTTTLIPYKIKWHRARSGSSQDWEVPLALEKNVKFVKMASELFVLWAEVVLLLPHIPVQTLGQALKPVVDRVAKTDGGNGEAGSGDGNTGMGIEDGGGGSDKVLWHKGCGWMRKYKSRCLQS